MNDTIQADYEALQVIARRFGAQGESTDALRQRTREMMERLRDGWQGRGSEAFFAEMEQETLPAVQRLAAALREADRVTHQVADLLRRAEQEASRPFRDGSEREGAGEGGRGTGYPGGRGGWAGTSPLPGEGVVSIPGGGAWSPGGFLPVDLDGRTLDGILGDVAFWPGGADGGEAMQDWLWGGSEAGGALLLPGDGALPPALLENEYGFGDEMREWLTAEPGDTTGGNAGGSGGGGSAPSAPESELPAEEIALPVEVSPAPADEAVAEGRSQDAIDAASGAGGGGSLGGGGGANPGGSMFPDLPGSAQVPEPFAPLASGPSQETGAATPLWAPSGAGISAATPEPVGQTAWPGTGASGIAATEGSMASPSLVPVGLAAMAPFLALLGKAVKERLVER